MSAQWRANPETWGPQALGGYNPDVGSLDYVQCENQQQRNYALENLLAGLDTVIGETTDEKVIDEDLDGSVIALLKGVIYWLQNVEVEAVIGSIHINDGDDVAEGSTTDAKATDPDAQSTAISLLKGLLFELQEIHDGITAVFGELNPASPGSFAAQNLASLATIHTDLNPAAPGSFADTVVTFLNDILTEVSIHAVTIADGADVTLGAKADVASINPAAAATLMSFVKGTIQNLNAILVTGQSTLEATGAIDQAKVVDPDADASIVQLLKGMLFETLSVITQLTASNVFLDAIDNNIETLTNNTGKRLHDKTRSGVFPLAGNLLPGEVCISVTIKCRAENSNITVRTDTGVNYVMDRGEVITLNVQGADDVEVTGTAGETFYYIVTKQI